MDFNRMIPELSVFDIDQTKKFYSQLGFKIEYERTEDKFVFMSFQGSQFMFEQIHDDGWNIGEGFSISLRERNKFFNCCR